MSTVAVSGMPIRGLLRILGLALGVATVVGGVVGMGILRPPGTIAGLLASPRLVAYEQCLEWSRSQKSWATGNAEPTH
jgi:hypothetical protein